MARGTGGSEQDAELLREIAALRIQLAQQTAEIEASNLERQQIEAEAAEAKSMLQALRLATQEAQRARDEQSSKLEEDFRAAIEEVEKVKREKEDVEQQRRMLEDKLARLVSSVNEWKAIAVQTTSKSAILGEEKRLLWEAKYAEARRQKQNAEEEKDKASTTLQEIELTKWRAEADGIRLQAELRLLEQALRPNDKDCNAKTQTEACEESPTEGNSPTLTTKNSQNWDEGSSCELSEAEADSEPEMSPEAALAQKLAEYEALITENQLQIARMEAEVEQWMSASEQLQQLGEDAVIEVMHENDAFKAEITELVRKFDAETQRRKTAEKEVTRAQAALNRLQQALDDAASLMIDEFVMV